MKTGEVDCEDDLESLRAKICPLVQPPFELEDSPIFAELRQVLIERWKEHLRNSPEQVDGEGGLVDWCVNPDEFQIQAEFDMRKLTANLHNLARWIPAARESFKVTYENIFRFEIMPAVERPKHWQTRRVSDSEVLQFSQTSKDSHFFHWFNDQWLYDVFWPLVAGRIEDFTNKRTTKFFVDFERFVGAYRGEPSSIVLFSVTHLPPIAHGYVTTSREVPTGETVQRISDSGFEWTDGLSRK